MARAVAALRSDYRVQQHGVTSARILSNYNTTYVTMVLLQSNFDTFYIQFRFGGKLCTILTVTNQARR